MQFLEGGGVGAFAPNAPSWIRHCVPSERLLSGAGILYEEHRNKLTAEHAEMLLFIKNNMNLLQVQK